MSHVIRQYFRFISVGISLLFSNIGHAQSLKIINFERETMAINVGVQKTDLNGNVCAIVKVQLPIAGVKFEGNIVGSEFDVNEYRVYLSPGSKKLTVKCPNFKPLQVEFSQFDNIKRLDSKGVYTLILCADNEGIVISDAERIKGEYSDIVSNATSYFEKKQFNAARELYDEAIKPKYSPYFNYASFTWITLCDTILAAQSRFEAVTPQLAKAFTELSSYSKPTGFSEGMMVIDHGYGNVTIISTQGDRYELSDAFVQLPMLYSEGMLSVNINDSQCYIGKKCNQVLTFRKSDYNKLFKDSGLDFNQFTNGYAKIFNRKGDGKIGIIDEYGRTVLKPTGKYNGIKVLKDRIILYDKKHIYGYDRLSFTKLEKKWIYKIMDYQGYVRDVTDDYILINNHDNNSIMIYPFSGSSIYKVHGDWSEAMDKKHILIRYKDKYFIYNLEDESNVEIPTEKFKPVKVVASNMVFHQQSCYSLSGNIIFSLPEKVECSDVGYLDDYMLVKNGNECRYIDKHGNTLRNSEFILPERANHLMHYCVRPFSDGFGLIIRDGKWGLIDRFGTTTFDYQ